MDFNSLLSAADVPAQFLRSTFLVGHTPSKALSSDPRVSYTLYIPPEHYSDSALPTNDSQGRLPLVVVVHGTLRKTSQLSGELIAFAHAQRCAILWPLFPAGLDDPNDLDSYKLLSSRTLRSDLALLSMLEETRHRWPKIDVDKVFLIGFSGGGQFCHRFAYLYPERLHAVSVGAPGRVTQLDENLEWPRGTKDVKNKLGRNIDMETIQKVKIQLVVGSEDNTVHGGEEFWAWLHEMKKKRRTANEGSDQDHTALEPMRIGRLDALSQLRDSWLKMGIEAQFDVVPGVAHKSDGVLHVVLEFFRPILTKLRNA